MYWLFLFFWSYSGVLNWFGQFVIQLVKTVDVNDVFSSFDMDLSKKKSHMKVIGGGRRFLFDLEVN